MLELRELTNEEYHADTTHISASQLKKIYSRGIWAWDQERNIPQEESPALVFGSAFHAYILEPDLFLEQYAIIPDFGDGRTKAAKQAKELFYAQNATKTLLSDKDFQTIQCMAESFQAFIEEFELYEIWQDALPEQSYFGLIGDTPIKIRYDKYSPKFNMCFDLKTTQDASLNSFRWDIRKFHYDLQDYHYKQMADRFIILAVEKKPPYLVQAYEIEDPTSGMMKWNEAIGLYNEYLQHGIAPRNTQINMI